MAYITKKTTVDGIKPIGSNLYGTCSTASGTATKTVSMPDFNVLVEGVTIHVYFQNENTADTPTLKVGSTSAQPIRYNGQAGGSWEAGGFISFTYYNGSWIQNDITIAGVTYTFTINDHTMTISGSDGSTQTITLPDNNTTYTLSKSGSTITLTGSDGSTTSVTDDNTTYSGMTQAQGEAGTSTTKMVISPKVLHDVVEALDDNTTYSIGISGHTITLTPSEGTPQSVTVPDNNTTYTISKSGNTVTLTGSDGSTQTFTDSDTTYSAGTGLQLSGTTFSVKTGYTTSGNNRKVQADSNGNLYVVQKDDNTTYTAGGGLQLSGTEFSAKTGYTTSGNNRAVQTDANGNLYVVQKDNNTTYTAGTGLELDGTQFKAKLGYTTSGNNRAVQADSNGNLYVTQKDDNTTTASGAVEGSLSSLTRRGAFVGNSSNTQGSNTWYKAASLNVTRTNTDGIIVFLVTDTMDNSKVGILRIRVRPASTGLYGESKIEWLTQEGYALTDFRLAYKNGTNSCLFELWTNVTTSWAGRRFIVLSEGNRIEKDAVQWTLYTTFTTQGQSGLPSGYTAIESVYAGQVLKLAVPRVGNSNTINVNSAPLQYTGKWEEYGPSCLNLPTSHWYFVQTMRGQDNAYCVQLAIGETTQQAFYRVLQNNTWGDWKSITDTNTTYSAGTGLDLDGTEFNHSNAVTAVTTAGLRKVKYDAQGHITGSSAVAKADITALGIPGDDTNNRRGFYGTCTTAAATAAKTVTLGSTAGWELVAGTIVGVKFSYTNTASNPTLNVNSSGAKSIIYDTGTITTSNLNKAGYASRIEYYMYDGSHWVWIGWSVDENTWQSNTNARAGYVASGANQVSKVWKTDEDGNPAWREEIKYPIRIVTGTSGATTSLSNGVITKVPLTVTGTNLSGNVGSTLTLNSTTRAIRIIGKGLYRITASVYIIPAVNAMIGAYIMVGTDSTNFSDAVEGASSLSYATTTGGAVNITQTIDVPANSTVYVYLCARSFGTTGTAANGNQATFLEVEQVR